MFLPPLAHQPKVKTSELLISNSPITSARCNYLIHSHRGYLEHNHNFFARQQVQQLNLRFFPLSIPTPFSAVTMILSILRPLSREFCLCVCSTLACLLLYCWFCPKVHCVKLLQTGTKSILSGWFAYQVITLSLNTILFTYDIWSWKSVKYFLIRILLYLSW